MTPENPNIPAWAQRERHADLGWIAENLDVFSAIASVAFENSGRGDAPAPPTPTLPAIPTVRTGRRSKPN